MSAILALVACAVAQDHFYTLNTLPDAAPSPPSAPIIHVRLNVTIPTLVDRSEMVTSTSQSGIAILDHERWAAPLSDQVSQTLARDIERRRADLLIGDGRFDQPASPPVSIRVDIVRMSAQRNGEAQIEAHWRIADVTAGVDKLGSDTFTAPLGGAEPAAMAQAYSRLLSELAGRLAAVVRPR